MTFGTTGPWATLLDLATGVWVGNNDNSEMMVMSGSHGAAPLWHDFMEGALAGHEVREFSSFQSPFALSRSAS